MSGETDIEQARRAIQLGDRSSAARICGDILGKQADHIEALQLLCGIAEPGEADTVIGYLKRALALTGWWGDEAFHRARVAERIRSRPLGADMLFATEATRA